MIKIAKEKCVGCKACEQVCPSGAIRVVDRKAVVNDNCVHCVTCIKYCKPGAISEDAVAENTLLCRNCGAVADLEAVELPDHPFFLAVQFHPEFKSRPNKAHPLFSGFIRAALDFQCINAEKQTVLSD